MPRGSEHRLTGLLVPDVQGFALEVDGGAGGGSTWPTTPQPIGC